MCGEEHKQILKTNWKKKDTVRKKEIDKSSQGLGYFNNPDNKDIKMYRLTSSLHSYIP